MGTTERQGENVVAILVGHEESVDQDVVTNRAIAAKDTVSAKARFGGGATEVVGFVEICADDASHVRAIYGRADIRLQL